MPENTSQLIDGFGRHIDYVRLSVTDRCDFRCVYCMAEDMTFIPKPQILSLEEILQLGQAFTELGVRKLRLTGGEPLVRNNVLSLIEKLGALPGLDELAMTTNGSQLQRLARALVVVAGMEGALPSVVGGLVETPVIAVPTSVGYGASLGGLAALAVTACHMAVGSERRLGDQIDRFGRRAEIVF